MVLAAVVALSLAAADAGSISPVPEFASLQGGEPLGTGHSELALTAGYSALSATYAQAISDAVDAGAVLEMDWVTSEAFVGGLYRSLLWRSGATSVGWRARAGLYGDFGASWAIDGNRSDTGVQLAPGIALSHRMQRGILSLAADVPFTVTMQRGGGVMLAPRAYVAFETPLWGDLLAGARMGAGGLFAGSGAPFAANSPRATLDFSALLTYRLF
jgi:hypothetical protein